MVVILGLIILLPFILMLVGIIQLCMSDPGKKRTGRNLLLGGIALLGIVILIGYSVCSNINIGGGH